MTASAPDQTHQQLEKLVSHRPQLLRDKLHFNPTTGRVVLQGRVISYFEKQLAQEAVRSIDGISEIENELVVEWANA